MVDEVGGKTLLMQKAWQIIAQTPEGHSEKVAALREIIQQGNYKIDCDKLANIFLLEVLTLVIHRSLYENIGRDH